jgi:hypothetical protein
MSLVLEALQRQEAAGDANAAVSLAKATSQRRRHRLWLTLFLIAMAANAVLLAWVFGPGLMGTPQTTEIAEAAPGTAAGTSPETTRSSAVGDPVSGPGAAQPATNPAQDAARVAETVNGLPPPTLGPSATPRPPPAPQRVTLRNLPQDARTRFPGIAFSTHIYADDADLRAIVANGQRLQEGERVRGLEIVEINESGVVLAFERYLVELPIATDWDTP